MAIKPRQPGANMNISDSNVTMKFRGVDNDVIKRVKLASKSFDKIEVKAIPMPKSKNYSILNISVNAGSWFSSRNLYKEFLLTLSDSDCAVLAALINN